MPCYVHRRNTPEGPRYRYWSTIVDVYCTSEMTREQMAAFLMREGAFKPDRLERADAKGTSCMHSTRDMNGPWDAEICQECGAFHHAYDARGDGSCRECGEAADDYSHKPPCQETP